jgi:hypothetical protein
MFSWQSNTSSIEQTNFNNILQSNKESCSADCNNDISNSTFIYDKFEGDIEIDQSCTITNTSCVLSNSVDAQIKTILDEMSKQSASSGGMGISFNSLNNNTDLKQLIENNITQIQENSCSFLASDTFVNNYVYVHDTKGNWKLNQNNVISGDTCNLSNVSKAVTSVEVSASVDQKTSVTGFSILMLIVIIIICGLLYYVYKKFTGGEQPTDEQKMAVGGYDPKSQQSSNREYQTLESQQFPD